MSSQIKRKICIFGLMSALASGGCLGPTVTKAQTQTLTPDSIVQNTTPNATQSTMDRVINEACLRGAGMPPPGQSKQTNDGAFQQQCTAVVGASITDGQGGVAQNALNQITPNQFVAYNTQSTRIAGGQMNQLQAAVATRMDALYASLSGGSAGDDSIVEPFGVWFTNAYNTGAISSSFNQLGYNFGNWGLTVGSDYRVMDRLALGAAFTYQMLSTTFAGSLGNSETDMYTGTIYAAYTPTDNWHIDAAASYGGNDYHTTRHIAYSIGGNNLNNDAKSNPGGYHYSFNLRTGYNIVIDALTIEPYARFNYYTLTVDPYSEYGSAAWNLHVSQQNVNSLLTSLGAQFSYALSFPWGVLLPQFHAEWHHQYKNNAQATRASFLGDAIQQPFDIVTIGPTRNFATVGARLATSVGHGVSAVLGYDALLGYADLNSQRVTLSARLDF